ncbi:MAG: dimethyladenosine transferase [Candidatus Adlerbacteria bacterium GW2011_GWB1_54_7]|uniref:Ribosomal RNA small subunit methyltransferase A n=1 Tax=Candidatus Adlerbacteria bacterium GW2011_GWB1_54_7 TaxID=1618607 RepID=A0A0G1Y2A7_9BACT|nr:MAG: dimethyladenosine transferase [Candidatus Adlerbacteria bacterium GW2011_GWB1_54_7]
MQKKKSLGQHFLKNPYYLGLVADAAHIREGGTVLEIGPGEGTLTAVLLERGAKVVAIEKDSRLISPLRKRFAGQAFTVIEGDALDFDISKCGNFGISRGRYAAVGNIPYYITGALFKKFLTAPHQPSTLVFLIQKEVAERIARSKKESILSLSIKAYGTQKYIKTVPAGAFSPPPKVNSAILAVENISRKNFKDAAHEENFFMLIKKGFAQKRKFLKNNLGLGYSSFLQKAVIDDKVRAEDVPLQKWLALSEN